jgi:hypothetical protein
VGPDGAASTRNRLGGRILRYAETARTYHILLRMQWPGLEHHEALGSIERVGSIIAALR